MTNVRDEAAIIAHRKTLVTAAITGLVIGGLWALQAGGPLWEHAVRFGVLLFVVAPFATWRIRAVATRRAGGRTGTLQRLRVGRLVAAKAGLLVAALAATAALRPLTGAADYIVAAAMFLTVAFVGPRLLPWLAPERADREDRGDRSLLQHAARD